MKTGTPQFFLSLAIGVAVFLPSIAICSDTLPGTELLSWDDEDLSVRLMDSAHAFVDGQISKTRPTPDVSEERREQFRLRIGVVGELLPPRLEFLSSDPPDFQGKPPSSLVEETATYTIHQVRWDVIPGLQAEGLYVNPTSGELELPTPPAIVIIPDANNTPEDILGLTDKLPSGMRLGARFAEAGFRILIPAAIDRELYLGGKNEPDLQKMERSGQSHREWIYRQAFQMGRHVIGFEVQSVLAGANWLRSVSPGSPVSVAGYGEGGLVAFYAGACDPRIDGALVSGYFSPRQQVWSEPIYRNVFGLLQEGGDAGIALLYESRPLVLEHAAFPEVTDQKGELSTPSLFEVQDEYDRIAALSGKLSVPANFLLAEAAPGNCVDFPALAAFCAAISHEKTLSRTPAAIPLFDKRESFDPRERHERVFHQMESVVQDLVETSTLAREKYFFFEAEPKLVPGDWSTEKEHPTLDPANFIENSRKIREIFSREIIGEFDEELSELHPRTRKILENEHWTAWEVVLDVYGDFFSLGVLLLPNDLKPGEKRPVVVCQHGRHGLPRDTIDGDKSAYNDFAARLAERGFITFAPHNLYRHEDRYRWLDRKANTIGCTLFSFIIASHQQNLRWLKTVPGVDPDRIAFYGLSYGGESAVRIPAILEDYCLSICSGDFNQWTRKVADVDFPNGFMKSIEWEMPYWNLGMTFDYGEMAGLIFPRPFMVERGHHDRVSRDRWVAHEYARVRWLYAQFGLAGNTRIEYFQGGHSINGAGTFSFLHEHLEWPEP